MIPSIRSVTELMAITKSRDNQTNIFRTEKIDSWPKGCDKSTKYLKSVSTNKVELPDLPKSIRHKWLKKKEKFSRFFKELDYNNQIQSSYDLTLQERLNNNTYKDAA